MNKPMKIRTFLSYIFSLSNFIIRLYVDIWKFIVVVTVIKNLNV